jgi:RNA polymerase sigma factor (sigma-70 family)
MGDQSLLLEDFGAFYRAHLDSVLAFCMARVRDPELAADLAAEVFAAALIGRRRYRADRGTALQWLLGIAANKIADAGRRGHVERRAQHRLGIPAIEWTEDDYERVVALGHGERLVGMLAELPVEQREAVKARVLDERSYTQIASAYGVGEATIRKRVSRGLATLRSLVSKEDQ